MTLQLVGTSRVWDGGEVSNVGVVVRSDGNADFLSCCGWLDGKCVVMKVIMFGIHSGLLICRIASFQRCVVIVGAKSMCLVMA